MPRPTKILRRTSQFKRDYKRARKRGRDLDKLRAVVEALAAGRVLEERFRDHALLGGYKGSRECHLEPDWLLIYEAAADEVILIRTGTHADLFGR